ncbi:MAG: PadR family transcriptional regulator [Thermoplasmatota archaeon]
MIGLVSKGTSGRRDTKFEKDLITGLISLILLAVLDSAGEPLYGYQIAKKMEAEETTGITLKQGTIYPVLRSMEKKGLLRSKIKASESGPPRKYYQITSKGKEKLEIWKKSWRRMQVYVDTVLEGDVHE